MTLFRKDRQLHSATPWPSHLDSIYTFSQHRHLPRVSLSLIFLYRSDRISAADGTIPTSQSKLESYRRSIVRTSPSQPHRITNLARKQNLIGSDGASRSIETLSHTARRPHSMTQDTSSAAPAASAPVTGYELPWVEKYRPLRLDDVVGNKDTIDRLKVIQSDGNCPHLLISGLPGIGKTTSVLCLARALLGDAYKEGVLELNASDERGVDVVRNKIKTFAQKKVSLPPGRHKIIILDEADSMTPAAQQALRRTMEIYSNTTRFCFACNQSNKIIEPIQSRCAILRYGKVRDEQILKRLLEICKMENVEYSDEGWEQSSSQQRGI